MYTYILKQRQKDGSLWVSPEMFEGEIRQIRQQVTAGYLVGEPRWAETIDYGFFLYGLDRTGKPHETGTASPDFSE